MHAWSRCNSCHTVLIIKFLLLELISFTSHKNSLWTETGAKFSLNKHFSNFSESKQSLTKNYVKNEFDIVFLICKTYNTREYNKTNNKTFASHHLNICLISTKPTLMLSYYYFQIHYIKKYMCVCDFVI